MAKRPNLMLSFAPQAIRHLDLIESRYHAFLRRAIHEQLTFTPAEESRNRQPLDQPAPFEATCELRCRPDNRIRVFYGVDSASQVVQLRVPHDDDDLVRLMLGHHRAFKRCSNAPGKASRKGKDCPRMHSGRPFATPRKHAKLPH
jgi:hypothetical protein